MMIRWVSGFLTLVMLAGLFIGGAQPFAVGLVPEPWDKLAHGAFFFIFALLLVRIDKVPMVSVFVLSVLVGATDELHQLFLPGRVAGWDDWIADVVGAILGLYLDKKFKQYKNDKTKSDKLS